MDIPNLAEMIMPLLIAFQAGATSAMTDTATKLGKAAIEKIGSLIKSRFTKDGEGATNALATLKHNPTDASAQKAVRRRLEGLLEEDPAFAADIKAVIGSIHIDNSQHQSATGDDNSTLIQVQGSNNTVGKL